MNTKLAIPSLPDQAKDNGACLPSTELLQQCREMSHCCPFRAVKELAYARHLGRPHLPNQRRPSSLTESAGLYAVEGAK